MASQTAPLPRTDGVFSQRDEPSIRLSTLSYRSRTVAPMSELDLHRLTKVAQHRNRSEGVTGLMVYERGWIFQQLEGPSAGVARIWASIRKDRRHTSIEILGDKPVKARDFQDWDLKLTIHGAQAGLGQLSKSDEQPESISRLCRGERPVDSQATSGLPAFGDGESLANAGEALRVSRSALSKVIATVIVPCLCAARPAPGVEPSSLAATLVPLLLTVDAASAFAFVKTALCGQVSLASMALDLLEPAARNLGDLWQADDCSEVDVTLGLIRLQAIAREFGTGAPRLTATRSPVVLVAPQPGEAHMLGAALDAEMLWHAGWNPRVDFPVNSQALDGLVASTWIDALDLSLSPCFQRDHRLGEVGKTIASARLASLNPNLVVVVSGRIFSEHPEARELAAAGGCTGADATFSSASQAESTILQALRSPLRSLQPAR